MTPILTADDYGMTPGISRSILELASAHRLSATSCMTNMPAWTDTAAELRHHRSRMSIGLHLNLTIGRPLTRSPLLTRRDGQFLKLTEWILGPFDKLGREALEEEIDAQIEMFIDHMGHPPDHIDGHQHVHIVPGVRQRVLAVLGRTPWAKKTLVRNSAAPAHQSPETKQQRQKRMIVSTLALGFKRQASARGLALNDAFAGYSTFDSRIAYGSELGAALSLRGNCPLIMCHPGFVDEALRKLGDPVVVRREQEHAALMAHPDLPQQIWHAAREQDGPALDWRALMRGASHAH